MRISYWLEHETLDPASGLPTVKKYAPTSIITQSGWSDNYFELQTTPSLFTNIPAVEISTQFSAPFNKPIQLSSIVTDVGEGAKIMVTVTPEE